MRRKVIFTGGGTAGHVTVNLALIPKCLRDGWEVAYIGSENGIEKQLIGAMNEIPYFPVATGKLRRYFDWNNIKDPFKVVRGVYQAYQIIRAQKPAVVFSKGGFVSVPVVLGAWLNHVPIVIHESDLTPGLANRLASPFATKVCTTFPETSQYLGTHKAEHVGPIVRQELWQGNAHKGLVLCEFIRQRPVLLVMGGSSGSQRINQTVRQNLSALLDRFQVVHICGKGQVDSSLRRFGYRQFEFVSDELPDILAMSDFVVSRAGSNSIFEFLCLQKPMVLVPLPKSASRGDQILNAESFKRSGYCEILWDEELSTDKFMKVLCNTFEKRAQYISNMQRGFSGDALQRVYEILIRIAR